MVNILKMDLPCGVKAVTVPNADGTYTIIINAKHSFETQRKSYLHEIRKIKKNDFDKYDVGKIENDIRKEVHIRDGKV